MQKKKLATKITCLAKSLARKYPNSCKNHVVIANPPSRSFQFQPSNRTWRWMDALLDLLIGPYFIKLSYPILLNWVIHPWDDHNTFIKICIVHTLMVFVPPQNWDVSQKTFFTSFVLYTRWWSNVFPLMLKRLFQCNCWNWTS